jgi:hypothetical protein
MWMQTKKMNLWNENEQQKEDKSVEEAVVKRKTWKKLFDLIFWYERKLLSLIGGGNFLNVLLLNFIDEFAVLWLRKSWSWKRVLQQMAQD